MNRNICCILVLMGVLLFILLCSYCYHLRQTKEPFVCIAREYIRVEEEDDFSFEPVQLMCSVFKDDECTKYKGDCIKVDIDEELFYGDNEDESKTLVNMFESCMKTDPFVKIDSACVNNSSTIEDTGDCFLKNEKPNYYFDDTCDMLL